MSIAQKSLTAYHHIRTAYIKWIQGGGSKTAIEYAVEVYHNRVVVIVTDTSDVQSEQVLLRLLDAGVPRSQIFYKADEINRFREGKPCGIIITNKHRKSLLATIEAISSNNANNLLIWDEPDRDAPGHTKSKEAGKDRLLNKLEKLCGEVEYITASVLALVVSETNYTHTLEIERENGYLNFEDLAPIGLGDEDVGEMLRTGNMSPTLENFIRRNAEEGILIRVDSEVEDMELARKSIQKIVNVPVEVLNYSNKVDPKTFKGVLISFKMSERGITFPHLRHMIVNFSKTTYQNVVVQAFRNLGYGKISKTENQFAGNTFSIGRAKLAFKIEKQLRDILRKYNNDYKKRWEEVRKIEFKEKWPLLGKSNGFRIVENNSKFEKRHSLPYTPELEEELIKAGALLHKIVSGNGKSIKAGGRPFPNVINDIINQPPHSAVRLERADYQRINPEIAIQRLAPVEKVTKMSSQWGHEFNSEGYPTKLTLWKKLDDDNEQEKTYRYVNEQTKNRTAA
jgi:hypothetical protein